MTYTRAALLLGGCLLAAVGTGQRAAMASALAQPTAPFSEAQEAPGESPQNPTSSSTATGNAEPQPYQDPIEMLKDLDVQSSYFDHVVDGQRGPDGSPVTDSDREGLLRLLYACKRFRPVQLHRWGSRAWDPAVRWEKPRPHRGLLWTVSGTLTNVSIERPIPEIVERFGFNGFYRSDLTLGDGTPAVIYSRDVPVNWKLRLKEQGTFNDPVSAYGFFFKYAGGDDEPPTPVFVAERLAWHPQDLLLGKMGMDMGLFSDVAQRTRILGRERECFYQLMQIAHGAERDQLKRLTNKTFPGAPLLHEPRAQMGKLMAFTGVAKRATYIPVDDTDIQERFGIDHYYELQMAVEFENPVRFGEKVLRSYPVVFCVPQLPAGMPTGDNINEEVRATGFFMKQWSYESALSAETDENVRQFAPLFLGPEPTWFPRPSDKGSGLYSAVAGVLFVFALVGVWLGIWSYHRRDRQFREQTIARKYEPESKESLDGLEIDGDARPDFSNLDSDS